MLRKTLILILLAAFLIPACASADIAVQLRIAGVIDRINPDLHTVTVKTPMNLTTFKVVETTKIVRDGVPATFNDLRVGDYVVAAVVETTDGLVAQLVTASSNTQEVKNVAGVISGVNLETKKVTLKTQSGAELTFMVTEKTQIVKNGQPASLEKLKVGDNAKIAFLETSAGLTAVKIEAYSRPPLRTAGGKITAINYEAKNFTITNETGSLTFVVNERTVIYKDAFPVEFGKLVVGDFAKVSFFKNEAGDLVAVRVEATSEGAIISRIRGKVAEISLEKHIVVVVTRENARIPVLVAPGTEIIKFLGPVPLNLLMIGDQVEVTIEKLPNNPLAIALKINVVPSFFAGKITAIDPATHRVQVQREAVAMAFRVVEKTIIMKDGVRVGFDALKVGDFAEVAYFNFPDGVIAARIMAKSPL